MNFQWSFFVDIGIISCALLVATLIRAKVPLFQKYLIPNALTAGFLLLPFYNYLAPRVGLSSEGLGELVYHLLSLSFAAMSLRKRQTPAGRNSKGLLSTSVSIIYQYALQGLLGLILTFILISTFMPDLFPTFGLLLPLGFALGPGQSYAIGKGWEEMGFAGAGDAGLTFAAIGFLWACFGGVYLINHGLKKGWMNREKLQAVSRNGVKTGIFSRGANLPEGSKLTTETEAIDSMSVNIGIVLLSYLLSFLLLKLLTYLLSMTGDMGRELAVNLWAINFVFAALTAMGFRQVLRLIKVDHILDNGSLTRISGTAVDVMVAGAVGAISLVVVGQYWLPILIMSVLGGIMVFVTVPWICSRLFADHRFQRTLIIYGANTGTLPTGLALLRVLDPNFETPVASDYMYSSGITFALVIPLILAINLPAYSVTRDKPFLFWVTVMIFAAYLLFAIVMHVVMRRKRAFASARKLWLPGRD